MFRPNFWDLFKKKVIPPRVDPNNIPKHIAIIMDGNGRWARRRGLPREAGHVAGEDALRRTVEAASKLGVEYLTVYAFSTENWKRPATEIKALMELLKRAVRSRTEQMVKYGIKIRVLGRLQEFPEDIQQAIAEAEASTAAGQKLNLNIMLNYGGQAEITDAVKKLVHKAEQKELTAADISETAIADNLYTAGIPEPDLLIRTSGELRISNFLLWQTAYAEFYFTKTLWPDFNEEHFVRAVVEYQRRKRRKGDIA